MFFVYLISNWVIHQRNYSLTIQELSIYHYTRSYPILNYHILPELLK